MQKRTFFEKRAMRRAIVGSVVGLVLLAGAPANAQGLVKGMEQGARQGNKAAGPVGGVLGGAIGGVGGVVTGVLGVPSGNQNGLSRAAPKEAASARKARVAKGPPPQPTAEQIIAASDANIARIKTELKLTEEQEKHWGNFNSALHYLGRNGADRLNLRIARAQRDPPDDIIEQMRNEAQFLNDRALDQRTVADAAEPLYASLDAGQKATFIQEMVKLSRERGLD